MHELKSAHFALLFAASLAVCATAGALQPKEILGQRIFNDSRLSANHNQSCASCHSRDTGGTGAESRLNAHGAVYEGSVKGRYGNRKPPASTYATLAPLFAHDPVKGFVGGNFWDGRATGWKLGNPAADQAQGPFLNPLEQAVPSVDDVVSRVCGAHYGNLFRNVWGWGVCSNTERAFAAIALSIAAFEDSTANNQFSSKYDLVRAGKAHLDGQEARGLALFTGPAKCANCHTLEPSAPGPLFSDFTFDNLGVPPNLENPFYQMSSVLIDGEPVNPLGSNWIDTGLGDLLLKLAQDSSWRDLPYVTASLRVMSADVLLSLAQTNFGKHRVPTLRNVAKRPWPGFIKAYGHNGYFKSLQGIVHFYNTRDILPRCSGLVTEAEALASHCWPRPEVSDNVNTTDLGDLKLTANDERAIVAFLETLSDEWSSDHFSMKADMSSP